MGHSSGLMPLRERDSYHLVCSDEQAHNPSKQHDLASLQGVMWSVERD
jgi:hypothetical protein